MSKAAGRSQTGIGGGKKEILFDAAVAACSFVHLTNISIMNSKRSRVREPAENRIYNRQLVIKNEQTYADAPYVINLVGIDV